MDYLEKTTKRENEAVGLEFNFIEIAELESAMASLVWQLRDKIDSRVYDTLIGDDVGGRIPTLVLGKIIKDRNPDLELKTFFVASGKTYLPSRINQDHYELLQKYLIKNTHKTSKALIVTQFIFSGKTLVNMVDALHDAGLDDIDIAAVDAMPHFDYEDVLRGKLSKGKLYIGSEDWHQFHEGHKKWMVSEKQRNTLHFRGGCLM